jgi:large subunit ribosomal protein L15
MKLSDLRPPKGATKNKTRKGRGIAAGKGKTAGRGTKGQGARAGGTKGPYFEGGQLPLVRRLPHVRGFHNKWRQPFEVVNLDTLETRFDANAQVTPDVLHAAGLIKATKRVKVLGRGDITKALQVSAHAFSDSAKEKIVQAGGTASELPWQRPPRKIR